ncbi:FecCD family ABC transporter permease [Kitasatospora sp. NPDC094019]|uniref:FecCD family ABC transporter permease n=1 Tax=Kitasatospora sp. NPDC094019 TaxID=3364091 RepID=UPI00382D6720
MTDPNPDPPVVDAVSGVVAPSDSGRSGLGITRLPGTLGWVLRHDRRDLSLRVTPRAATVALVLTAVLLALMVVGIVVGGSTLATADVLRALTGRADPATVFVVQELRMPRVATAALVGGCLGAAGLVFQRVARNPLASPDLIGFTAGASTGAVFQILVVGGTAFAVPAGAVAGGLLTGVAVYLLAWRDGLQGSRLVVVGLALSAMLLATTSYLLSRARITDAVAAAQWLVGSLNNRGWEDAAPVAVAAVLVLPLLAALMPKLRMLELGEDHARGLGVRADLIRVLALLSGVVLTSGAVAAAGPVPFVALAAPQIAARLGRGAPTTLWPSVLCGAVLTLGADALTQQLFPGAKLPVGVVTGVLGGLYLAVLLRWQRRSR